MKTGLKNLKLKCSYCGYWNRFPVNKIFVEQPSSEQKVKVLIPFYKPLKIERCGKCNRIIAEPNDLIRIEKKVEC
jgi:hypothetical protein